jgi:PhnB protein
VSFMASDTEKASAKAAKIDLSLSGSDEAKLKKYFDALSEGGNVQMPLEKQFWGDTFGMLTDKYGIEWMVNVNAPKE